MAFDIEIAETEDEALLEAINAGLSEHAAQCGVDLTRRPLAAAVRDEAGEPIAGLTGNVLGPYFYVARLWVAGTHRGKGLGRALMESAERRAAAMGATTAYLNTFGFQSPGFYEGLGYTTFAQLEGPTEDENRYFMNKPLQRPADDEAAEPRDATA